MDASALVKASPDSAVPVRQYCDTCREHISNVPKQQTVTFDRNAQEITLSAEAGCPTCAIFDMYLDGRILAGRSIVGKGVKGMFFDPAIGNRKLPSFVKEKMKARVHLVLRPIYSSSQPGRDHIPSGPINAELKFHLKFAEGEFAYLDTGIFLIVSNFDFTFQTSKSFLERGRCPRARTHLKVSNRQGHGSRRV
jgi:hypothetical protein